MVIRMNSQQQLLGKFPPWQAAPRDRQKFSIHGKVRAGFRQMGRSLSRLEQGFKRQAGGLLPGKREGALAPGLSERDSEALVSGDAIERRRDSIFIQGIKEPGSAAGDFAQGRDI